MAVAAYASVLSLLRVVKNVQHPSHLRLFPDPTQVDALQEKLRFLQDFLEVHSSAAITRDTEQHNVMMRKISRAAYDAEISIDSYVVDRLYAELYSLDRNGAADPNNNDIESIQNEIYRAIKEIESVNEALAAKAVADQERPPAGVVRDKVKQLDDNDRSFAATSSAAEKNKMVGFDDQLKQVLGKLAGNRRDLVVLPITGMGGIGKTTLARSLFDHPYNLHHFDVRIWLTISQDYSLKVVLQGLLRDGVLEKDEEVNESEAELIKRLYQKLFGQRYLIVLDDVWSTEAWDDLKRGFPDNGKGNRVIVTTRLSDLASSLASRDYNTYAMKFLDDDKSWDLFREIAFERGARSRELEQIGREISKRCKGLPLLLVVVAGQLANSNMTAEYWQTVRENLNSFAYDEHCLRTLSLSYHHLPIHLKPCFLYMRHFKEDAEVDVSRLIKAWVCSGFVKPMSGKTLEEAAREYLADLIGRHMLLVRKRHENGNVKACGIHDLQRDLCIKESEKEQFLELPKSVSIEDRINSLYVVYQEQELDLRKLNSEILGHDPVSEAEILARSSCNERTYPELARSRFVRAIDFKSVKIPLPTTSRSIICPYSRVSFSGALRLFWNLEIFNMGWRRPKNKVFPKELWEIPPLRRVKASGIRLPDRVSTTDDDDVIMVLENLQTLTSVEELKLTEENVKRIPNLTKLGLHCEEKDWSCYRLQNLVRLQKLESLSIISNPVSMDLKKGGVIAFPWSLKQLTLEGCGISWDDLTIIVGSSSLPSLRELKLMKDSVLGDEWSPVEGGFLRLKYLKLHRLNLVRWRVDETHFPALEALVVNYLQALDEIPREIGELPSLSSINLSWCNKNTVNSAKAMIEEQLSYGNERLVLCVQEPNEAAYLNWCW